MRRAQCARRKAHGAWDSPAKHFRKVYLIAGRINTGGPAGKPATESDAMKHKTGIAFAVVILLAAAGLSYIALRGTRLLDSQLGNGYVSESYSYDVTASPAESGSFELLLPYPQLIVDEIRSVDGNATFRQHTSEYGRCLNVTCNGPSRLLADNTRKMPLNSRLIHDDLALTMTNGSPPFLSHPANISAWIWSSRANISLELKFSSAHSTFNPAFSRFAVGDGFNDRLNCTLKAGWQNVTIERNWMVT
jgi:hypothetical protein